MNTEQPVTADRPGSTDEPLAAGPPVTTSPPVTIDQRVSTGQPLATDQPVAGKPYSRWYLRRDLSRAARRWDQAEEAIRAFHGRRETMTWPGRIVGRRSSRRAHRAVRAYGQAYARALERCTLELETVPEPGEREALRAVLTGADRTLSTLTILPLAAPLSVAVRGLVSRPPERLRARLRTPPRRAG
ncbi:hypothetical protein KIH74_21350 [Kineosporia sp. J2-2]|uniref:Uncharacterized protein n=1 Tax=Kineosporia corallincola TaxID=2835133 RepID=A0ABS5TK69_9ACTN|nr:hypothetical protein [Kineosporia corallincola]MBT0771498.1 hypothetical protein [Kineosporia corallincola]